MALEFDSSVLPNVDGLDRIVGRQAELNAIDDAFDRGVRVVSIEGFGGVGKTALASLYVASGRRFGRQARFLSAREGEIAARVADTVRRTSGKETQLLVLDGLDEAPDFATDGVSDLVSEVRAAIRRDPNLSVLVTTRRHVEIDGDTQVSIKLGNLSYHEALTLVRQLAPGVDERSAELLVRRLEHHPLAIRVAASALRTGAYSVRDLLSAITNFESIGILGPDGQPLSSTALRSSQIVTDVTAVNDELLQVLHRDPKLLWTISPRKFEEVVAELISRLGYAVELTPASKDGGFDIYAARRDGLGEFMYLVECKRYAPTRKVGVEIVRSLHGVVNSVRATAGIVVTTSHFTSGAEEFQKRNSFQLQLHDYLVLRRWLDSLRKPLS